MPRPKESNGAKGCILPSHTAQQRNYLANTLTELSSLRTDRYTCLQYRAFFRRWKWQSLNTVDPPTQRPRANLQLRLQAMASFSTHPPKGTSILFLFCFCDVSSTCCLYLLQQGNIWRTRLNHPSYYERYDRRAIAVLHWHRQCQDDSMHNSKGGGHKVCPCIIAPPWKIYSHLTRLPQPDGRDMLFSRRLKVPLRARS